MKKLLFILFLFLVFLIYLGQTTFVSHPKAQQDNSEVRLYDLDIDGNKEQIAFHSYQIGSGSWQTNVYVNKQATPQLTLRGFFKESHVYDIKDNFRILEIELIGGKSVNSLVYKSQNGKLIRIPVSTEKPPGFIGIVSRNLPEFKDMDNDGVLEMIAYYRLYPPEKKRTVEIYKLSGKIFMKYQEYEEETPMYYL